MRTSMQSNSQHFIDHFGFQFCETITDPETAKDRYHKIQVLASVAVVTSFLSLLGSGSVIFYAVSKGISRNPEVKPLLHLSIADFMLALLWMAGSVTHFAYPTDNVLTATACFGLQAFTEMVHIMSYFLTANYAVNVFLGMKEKRDRFLQFEEISIQRHPIGGIIRARPLLYVASWIIPVILFIPLCIQINDKDITACQKCIILLDVPNPGGMEGGKFLWHSYGSLVMVVTLGVSTIVIVVIYMLTLHMYRKTLPCFRTDRQRKVIQLMASRMTIYVIVFLYCWGPALVLQAIKLCPGNTVHELQMVMKYFPVYLLQIQRSSDDNVINI